MIFILLFVIALVAWSLHLMQEAVDQQEFSLMLAGTLVAMAAAAMVAVYFLMGDYMSYVNQMAQQSYLLEQTAEAPIAVSVSSWPEAWPLESSEAGDRSLILANSSAPLLR